MGHEWVLWVLAAACAMHVVEEHALGWQGWAAGYIGPRVGSIPRWSDFWVTNAFLIVYAVAVAAVGWRAPAFALSLPAGLFVDVALFHVVPSLQARRPNPGLFTGLLLYVPIVVWAYLAAGDDGVLSVGVFLLSVVIGAAVMAVVVVMLAIHARLGYPDVSPASSSTSSAPR